MNKLKNFSRDFSRRKKSKMCGIKVAAVVLVGIAVLGLLGYTCYWLNVSIPKL